jgi:hypothetical protein
MEGLVSLVGRMNTGQHSLSLARDVRFAHGMTPNGSDGNGEGGGGGID